MRHHGGPRRTPAPSAVVRRAGGTRGARLAEAEQTAAFSARGGKRVEEVVALQTVLSQFRGQTQGAGRWRATAPRSPVGAGPSCHLRLGRPGRPWFMQHGAGFCLHPHGAWPPVFLHALPSVRLRPNFFSL